MFLNNESREFLTDIFFKYGEERYSKKIAAEIEIARDKKKLKLHLNYQK